MRDGMTSVFFFPARETLTSITRLRLQSVLSESARRSASIRFRGGTFKFWSGGGDGCERKHPTVMHMIAAEKKFSPVQWAPKSVLHGEKNIMTRLGIKLKFLVHERAEKIIIIIIIIKRKSCLYHSASSCPPPIQKSNGSPLGTFFSEICKFGHYNLNRASRKCHLDKNKQTNRDGP